MMINCVNGLQDIMKKSKIRVNGVPEKEESEK